MPAVHQISKDIHDRKHLASFRAINVQDLLYRLEEDFKLALLFFVNEIAIKKIYYISVNVSKILFFFSFESQLVLESCY